MKLLFDESVSPRLVAGLSDLFPGSVHVRDVGLARATDAVVWRYARAHSLEGLGFPQMGFLRSLPLKVIWIRRGQGRTADIESLLRSSWTEIFAFGADAEASFLALS